MLQSQHILRNKECQGLLSIIVGSQLYYKHKEMRRKTRTNLFVFVYYAPPPGPKGWGIAQAGARGALVLIFDKLLIYAVTVLGIFKVFLGLFWGYLGVFFCVFFLVMLWLFWGYFGVILCFVFCFLLLFFVCNFVLIWCLFVCLSVVTFWLFCIYFVVIF